MGRKRIKKEKESKRENEEGMSWDTDHKEKKGREKVKGMWNKGENEKGMSWDKEQRNNREQREGRARMKKGR